MKEYKIVERNYDGVEHSDVRKEYDKKYIECHDYLSKCYYEKKPFSWKNKDYGILDKETFDKLHGLIFLHYDAGLEKHEKMDTIIDDNNNKKSTIAKVNINEYKKNGIELEI